MSKRNRPAHQLTELVMAFIEGGLQGLGIVVIIGVIAIIAILIFCFQW